MSSVESKKGSGQDEVTRKAVEDYRKKEAELIKKHNREIRAITEKHQQDIASMSKDHSDRLSEARNVSRESLTNRDLKYQKEMEQMRRAHTKQLEKLMMENQSKIAELRKANEMQLASNKSTDEDQTRRLLEQTQRGQQVERERFDNALNTIREENQKVLAERARQINKAHDNEKEKIRDERNDTVSDLRHRYRQLQHDTQHRLREQESRHMQDKMRLNTNHMDTVEGIERKHADIQASSREGYERGIEQIRDRFAEAREKDLMAQNDIRDKFEADTGGRINDQIHRLKRELTKAKEQSIVTETKAKSRAQKEIDHVRDAYQAKYEQMESSRKELLDSQNKMRAEDIRYVQSNADKLIKDSSDYYRNRMDVENFKNRQAIESMEKDFAARVEAQTNNADARIERVRAQAYTTEDKLRENFKTNLEMQKDSALEQKREILVESAKTRAQAESILKSQIQKQEVDHQRKMADVVSKYEKRISDLNDQIVKDKRLRENREKSVIKDLKRQHDAELAAVQMKYQERERAAQLAHEKEIKDTNRRQQEKLNDVLSTIRKQQT